MKAISIPQPWAQLVACGFKETIDSSWELTAFPMRVLIHASGVDPRIANGTLPDTCKLLLDNASQFGYIGDIDNLPTDAIIGCVDVVGCDKDVVTEWSDPDAKKNLPFVFYTENARRFKDAVLGYKGRSGLFEVKDFDEDELPASWSPNLLRRDGVELALPISQKFFDSVTESGDFGAISFNVLDSNFHIFCEELVDGIQPLPIEYLTMFPDYYHYEYRVTDIELVEMTDEETGEPLMYTDQYGAKKPYTKVVYHLSPIEDELFDSFSESAKEVVRFVRSMKFPYFIIPEDGNENGEVNWYAISNCNKVLEYENILLYFHYIIQEDRKMVTLTLTLKEALPDGDPFIPLYDLNEYNSQSQSVWFTYNDNTRQLSAHITRHYDTADIGHEELYLMFDNALDIAKKKHKALCRLMLEPDEDLE